MNKKMTLPEFKVRVGEIINRRNAKLASLFKAGVYDEMAEEFGLHSRIVTHEGEVITGKDSENYWRNVGEKIGNHQEKNLSFDEKYFDAMELTVSPAHKPEEFDFVAFEVTEFSFEAKGKTYSGYIDPPYRHRVMCTMAS